ncbi:conserved hypothetical protein [Ricinus communis]|uniref:SPX domain-containing protein n=1 Tax=Ricinus communis TaxID=3988 RepID=B9SAP5_RICCO|nr:conserved hypothetical protein [Ricinus communis]
MRYSGERASLCEKMKFFKKYQEYMQNQEKELPALGFKNLKKILKKCRKDLESHQQLDNNGSPSADVQRCPGTGLATRLSSYFLFVMESSSLLFSMKCLLLLAALKSELRKCWSCT